jgi:hypothetical protein
MVTLVVGTCYKLTCARTYTQVHAHVHSGYYIAAFFVDERIKKTAHEVLVENDRCDDGGSHDICIRTEQELR